MFAFFALTASSRRQYEWILEALLTELGQKESEYLFQVHLGFVGERERFYGQRDRAACCLDYLA